MDYLGDLPSPTAIHIRLGQIGREQQLLRRLLRLSMATQEVRSLDAAQASDAEDKFMDTRSLATLVSILVAARRIGDRDLERETRRQLEERFGVRLTFGEAAGSGGSS